MIGYLGYRAARGQVRMYRKSRGRKGGPWTGTAVLLAVLPFTLLWQVVAPLQHQLVTSLVLLGVNTVMLLLVLAPVLGRRSLYRKLERRSQREVTRSAPYSPDFLRERADLLEELEDQRKVMRARLGRPAELVAPPELKGRLFSVRCPEPTCLAPASVACNMGIGVPVALVDKKTVQFCHLARFRVAIEAGAVTAEEVEAQFDGHVPEGVR